MASRPVTPEVVAKIRSRFAAGEGITTIARELRVEEANALRIARGQAWKHLPPADLSNRVLRRRLLTGDEHPLHGRPELRARGEDHPAAKLDDAAVREIRRRAGDRASSLAQEFGVAPITIERVRARVTWTHVT